MNSRKSKRRKSSKKGFKTKTNDGEAEVFVLPPDLLQKLGINLESVRSTQGNPTDVSTSKTDKLDLREVSVEPVNSQNSEKLNSTYDESSTNMESHRDTTILETADLMKKSVFLSPTFLIADKNFDSGEIEIANVLEPKNLDDEAASNNMPEQAAVDKPFLQNIIQTDILEKPEIAVSTDDHSDEAYLSDCSTSNSGPSETADNTLNYIPEIKPCDFEMPKEVHNKVKIISEEILSPSKFKDLQTMLSPKRSDFIPVSMNCVLSSNKFCENVQYDINTVAQNALAFPPQYKNSRMHNDAKTDLVVLYDQKGNIISTVSNNMPADVMDPRTNYANNFDIMTGFKIENLSPPSDRIEIKTGTKSETQTPENSLGDIDLVVIDMEMEENEDILQNFVNEITSNDDNKILEKIDQSEKACLPKSNPEPKALQINTTAETNLECCQPEFLTVKMDDKVNKNDAICVNINHSPDNMFVKQIEKIYEGSQLVTINNKTETNLEFVLPNSLTKMTNIMNDDQNKDGIVISETNSYETELIRNVKESLPKIAKQTKGEDSSIPISHSLRETEYIQSNIVSVTRTITEKKHNDIEKVKNGLYTDLFNVEYEKDKTQTAESLLKSSKLPEIKDRVFDLSSEELKEINKYGTSVANNKIFSEEKSKSIHNNMTMHKINEVSSKLDHNNIVTSGEENAPDDKVQEIALYLSQFAKNQTRSVKLRRKSDKSLKAMPTKRSKLKSLTNKLCIQGVEKPGGSEKSKEDYRIKKVLKTYTRIDKSYKNSVPLYKSVTSPTKVQDICAAINEQANDCIMVEKNKNKPEFCLCSDFGRLACYDSQYPYEHIHFWEHKVIKCDSEIIFSIYNDIPDITPNTTPNTEIKESLEFSESQTQNSDTFVHSICWHSCKTVVSLINETSTFVQDLTSETINNDETDQDEHITQPMQTANSLDTHCQLQRDVDTNECTSVAVSQGSELHKLDLNATKVLSSQSQATNVDNIFNAVSPLQNILNCNQDASPENTDENLSHKKVSKKDDKQIELSESDLNTEKSNIVREQAEETIVIQKIFDCDAEIDTRKRKKKSKSSKSINRGNDVERHITVAENKNQFVDKKMAEKFTPDDSSNIFEDNESKQDLDLKSVGKQNATVEENKQPSDLIAEEVCTDSTDDRSRTKKRRKSVKRIEDDEEMLPSKKSVKCDVCKKLLSKSQWDSHISTEHCFIAWKVGDSFDFEDPRLLKKMQEKVKNRSSLKCAFCSTELIHPKKFLTHVQRCFAKLEASLDVTSKSSMNETVSNENIEDYQLPDSNAADQTVDKLPEGNESVSSDDNVSQCGVCKEIVATSKWMEHITRKHEYLAWKNGDTPLNLNDEEDVRLHLINVVREVGELKCSKCGLARKYPKTYMLHIRDCTGKEEIQDASLNISSINETAEPRNPNDAIKCGVCHKSMLEADWIQHIKEAHEYLAWREGEKPLDKDNADSVRVHLYNICKQNGGLVCNKCGCNRKYVKTYMHHVNSCQGPTIDYESMPATITPKVERNSDTLDKDNSTSDTMVKCGVCDKEVWPGKWIHHIGRVHNYMAWREGESLDTNNEEEVYNHLYEIVRKLGYLVCSKCGVVRKYVKAFLQHTKTCDSEAPAQDYDDDGETKDTDRKQVCALCSEEVDSMKWKKHKMEKHYNVAWTVGSIPVDFKNPNVIDSLMKEYRDKYKKMVCNVCHATRVSRVGFYAHVIACGKTEEEVEIHRNLCKICNKKYLSIYHNQHMAWHTQQEYARERKLKAKEEEEQELVKEMTAPKQETRDEEATPGRRRAAQKARHIIENFKNEQFAYKCPNCKFGGDSTEELANHVCKGKDGEELSDSGESAKVDYSGDESDDSIEEDSNASDEEQAEVSKNKKKKKYPAYTVTQRFPHVPKNLTMFLAKIGAEFHQQHFTYDSLFPDLREFDCKPVPADQLHEYLPPLEESCKVQFCDDNWKIYKRFEAEQKNCMNAKNIFVVPCQSIFTGGCIQCISWAPPEPDEAENKENFLAVACHRGADIPRMLVDDTASHPGLIQIWNFGTFSQVAEFVFGLAHDYGTAWAMDWCPCGARDELGVESEAGNVLRLGLLAVAFSSGRVAVFSIPYPATLVKREQLIQKIKPVVELRLTMNPDRKIYQATSVCWSSQKPNESIVVGYGDGTTAYYDLNTESPFLKTVENDIVILYPYHDERVHNTCVTGVSLYPSVDSVGPAGAACSSSVTGVALLARPGVRPARQHTNSAVGGAQFEPLWPCAALTGDDANIASSVNEIEWYGGGRRMGGGSASAGCRRCGRFVFAALPLLRVRYPHPADNMAKKQILGLVQMTPLIKKRKKLANDELQTKVEPTTYEDAIKKYGIELRIDKESIEKTANKPREHYPERYPERFPLGDVTSMAFCPEVAHHRKLAVATHSGMLFVLQV